MKYEQQNDRTAMNEAREILKVFSDMIVGVTFTVRFYQCMYVIEENLNLQSQS